MPDTTWNNNFVLDGNSCSSWKERLPRCKFLRIAYVLDYIGSVILVLDAGTVAEMINVRLVLGALKLCLPVLARNHVARIAA